MLAQVLAPVVMTLAAIGAVERFCQSAATTWLSLTSGIGANPLAGFGGLGVTTPTVYADTITPAAAAPIAALSTVPALPTDATFAPAVCGLLSSVSGAAAATSNPVVPAAVAPGGSTAAPVAVDGPHHRQRDPARGRRDGPLFATTPAPGPALAVVAQSLALADAVTAASYHRLHQPAGRRGGRGRRGWPTRSPPQPRRRRCWPRRSRQPPERAGGR